MLEAHRDEGGDRQQRGDELARRVLRAEGYPDGEADEPVAEHAAYEHVRDGERRLHRRKRERRRAALLGDEPARIYERREEERADEVRAVDGAEVAQHRGERDFFRKVRDRHEAVAGHELRARGEHEEKSEREDDAAQKLRDADARHLRRVLRDDEHEISAHSYICSREEAHQQHSPEREPALRDSRRERGLRNFRRRLDTHKNFPLYSSCVIIMFFTQNRRMKYCFSMIIIFS